MNTYRLSKISQYIYMAFILIYMALYKMQQNKDITNTIKKNKLVKYNKRIEKRRVKNILYDIFKINGTSKFKIRSLEFWCKCSVLLSLLILPGPKLTPQCQSQPNEAQEALASFLDYFPLANPH